MEMNVYARLDDNVLTDLLQKQDGHAFTELYNRYWGLMFTHARRMVKDDDLANDIVQEVFLKLWQHSKSINISGSVSGYLYRSLRNHILNHIEKQRVRQDYLTSLARWIQEGHRDTEDEMAVRELEEQIESEVTHLPPRMRQVFELSRHACLSYKEIAAQVNISEGTVKKQIYNALKILKNKLSL